MSADSQQDNTAAQINPREPISALGSANAATIFFDESAFFGAINGVGEIALSVTRYCDVHGSQVQSERVLVGHLRGSLQALKTLSYAVEVVIKMLETEREREAAGNQAMAILRDAAKPTFQN